MLESPPVWARTGEDVTIGRYVTSDTVRLGVSGLSAGLAVGLFWRAAGRTRWGAAPFLVAVLAAAGLTGRFDWPRDYDPMVAAGAIVTMLAGAGAFRCLADRATHWAWVAAAALISAAGVWAGVPETGPALLAGGGLIGLVASAAARPGLAGPRRRAWVWPPFSGGPRSSGAAGRPWAALGGALCTGVAPWLALRPLVPTSCGSWSQRPRPWLLGAHMALVLLATRWVGVDPHAGWGRVAIVVFAGMAVAMATRRQA